MASSSSDVTVARRLVRSLERLGGDIQTTVALAGRLTPGQWADLAEHLADVAAPSPETVALVREMLAGVAVAEATFLRRTCGNFPYTGWGSPSTQDTNRG